MVLSTIVNCNNALLQPLICGDSNVLLGVCVQSCSTLWDPMDCSLPGFPVHGIFQARIMEWVAISFSRGSSQPRDRTQVSHTAGRHFTLWTTGEEYHRPYVTSNFLWSFLRLQASLVLFLAPSLGFDEASKPSKQLSFMNIPSYSCCFQANKGSLKVVLYSTLLAACLTIVIPR